MWNWLVSQRDALGVVLQFFLLLATIGLIVVGIYQALAARAQSRSAKAQIREMQLQGAESRRPFLQIRPGAFHGGKTQAELTNVGPGIALSARWRFLTSLRIIYQDIGAIGVGVPTSLYYEALGRRLTLDIEEILNQGGIRIEYSDTAAKRYWTTVKRTPEGTFILDTGDLT